jgi:alanyl-tRNA synthetase
VILVSINKVLKMKKTLDEKLFKLFDSYGIPVTITVHKDTWIIKKVGEIDKKKNMAMILKEHGRG